MRLGLLGGTFDPVHLGHLLLAECCREQLRLDRVLFLPAAVPPHKRDRQLTPAAQRIEMLELAVAGHQQFAISRREIDRGGVSYTVDTLRQFREEDPEGELFLLMGADMLHDLPHWRAAETVCRLAVVAVVRRAGTGELDFTALAAVASPQRIELFRRHQVEMPAIGLSSTEIRRRAAAGQSIRYQTPRAVEKYIEAQALYHPSSEDRERT
jgi:nicotinate-nucleotide adenylyltransferase